MNAHEFDLDSGALCLDFVNTVNWHASDHPADRLGGYADLAYWGEAAGILPAGQAERLVKAVDEQTDVAAQTFKNAIQLREAIYHIFANISDGVMVNPDDLVILNLAVGQAFSHLQVEQSPAGFIWSWKATNQELERVSWAAARSAAELLTSTQLERARKCADDHGCGYLFIDTSRNRSRRWCSMESCGNRAKARRHYQNL